MPNEEKIQKSIEKMLKARKEGFYRSAIDSSRVTMIPRSSFWRSNQKTEKIDTFETAVWDLSNFVMRYTQRKVMNETSSSHGMLTLSPTYFQSENQDPRGKGYGMIYDSEKVFLKEKKFSATVWLSEQYPLSVQQLLPIIEVILEFFLKTPINFMTSILFLQFYFIFTIWFFSSKNKIISPTHKHFNKLSQFLQLKFPKSGFPVKLDIPILPTLSAIVTFSRLVQHEIKDDIFDIPENFPTDKIRLEFEM